MSEACTPNIPLIRKIDGFEFLNKTVHESVVNSLKDREQKLVEVVNNAILIADDADMTAGTMYQIYEWEGKAREVLKELGVEL